MWGPWMQIHPTEDQKKKWEKIPDRIFWIKMSVLIALNLAIGLLLVIIINN